MTGPGWPGQLAAALNLLALRARADGVTLPDAFFHDAREAVRQASAGTDEQTSPSSGGVCQRRHVDDVLVLTKSEAATMLSCSLRTVGTMLDDGRLHRVEGLGRSCRIARSEVEAFAGIGSVPATGVVSATGPGPAGPGPSAPRGGFLHVPPPRCVRTALTRFGPGPVHT